MPLFSWMAIRLETASARYSRSLGTARALAYSMTGTDTVMPWLPLPELMTTGSSQPLIRASEPAAALAMARLRTSSP